MFRTFPRKADRERIGRLAKRVCGRTVMTEEELDQLLEIVRRCKLPVVPYGYVDGFMIRIFSRPGIFRQPVVIATFFDHELPLGWNDSNTMDLVSKEITHTARNRKLLRKHNLPVLQDPGYYAY